MLRRSLILVLLAGLWGQAHAALLEGRVIDQESKQPVGIAAVFVGTIARTETDASGQFRLDGLPPGEQILRVEHVGFEPWKRTIVLSDERSLKISVRLQARIATLEPVDVTSARPDPSVPQSKRTLTGVTIRRSAGTVATDPLRAIQSLPGVAAAAGDDFSDRYVVRGGEPEENLVLFDGFPLLQPIHLEGFTSVVYDDLIGGIELYPGALPPRFGNALSSVTLLSPAQPKRMRAYFRYDLGSVALGGEIPRGEASVLGAGRMSFYNLLLQRPPDVEDRSFQDFSAKATRPVGALVGSVTAVASRDRETGNLDRSADSYLLGVRLGSKPGPRMARVGLSLSERDRSTSFRGPDDRVSEETVAELRRALASCEIIWGFSSSFQTRLDAEVSRDRFSGKSFIAVQDRVPDLALAKDEGGFVSAEGTWSARAFAVSAGGRLERIPFTKGRKGSPYASLRFRGLKRVTPGVGWRIVRQSPFPLYDNPVVAGLPLEPTSLLKAGKGELPPSAAEHLSASCEFELLYGFGGAVEIYRKLYGSLARWDDPAGPAPGQIHGDGKGKGEGIEMTLRRPAGRYATGWVSYSISRTRKKEGPSKALRPSDHDRPRMGQLALEVPITSGTIISASYRISSGRPYTPVVGCEGPYNLIKIPADEANGERLPDYRRLDVKLEHRVYGDRRDAFFYLDVLNVLNRHNLDDVAYGCFGGRPYRIYSQGVRITPVAGFGVYF